MGSSIRIEPAAAGCGAGVAASEGAGVAGGGTGSAVAASSGESDAGTCTTRCLISGCPASSSASLARFDCRASRSLVTGAGAPASTTDGRGGGGVGVWGKGKAKIRNNLLIITPSPVEKLAGGV